MSEKVTKTTTSDDLQRKASSDIGPSSASTHSEVRLGRENLSDALPPHASYEGLHRYDTSATWTPEEERKVVRKTDLYLLSWICVMVSPSIFRTSEDTILTRRQFFGLQLDRGNLSNAQADNFLKDLHLTTDDYNNVSLFITILINTSQYMLTPTRERPSNFSHS